MTNDQVTQPSIKNWSPPLVKKKEGKFKCSFEGCTKVFGKKSRLVYHEIYHTGEVRFSC